MIEDKKIGLKVAENEEEAFWEEIRKNSENDIKNLEKLLKFQKEILKLAESKLNPS